MLDQTLPQLLLRRAEATPDATAYREKDLGVWNERSWAQVAREVREAAMGLDALGVRRGDRVAVIADNITEWPLVELAAQSLGAISIGVYPSSVRDEVRYMLGYVEASVVLCEDQEQVDKVLGVLDELPGLGHIVYQDGRGMRAYADGAGRVTEGARREAEPDGPVEPAGGVAAAAPGLLSWRALLEGGRAADAADPHRYPALVAEGDADDVCHLSTTSGTTGRPKAAMLSHRNYTSMAYALHRVDAVEPLDDYVSFLPFAWIVEQVFAVALPLLTGMVVNFPESANTAMSDLREIGPHMMLGAPRVWEGVQSSIWVKIDEAYAVNRWVYRRLMAFGRRAAEYRMRGRRMPPLMRLGYALANQALFRPLKDQLGFLRLRRAYTGGAALGPDTFALFQGLGVNLKQVYGQTETAGLAYVQADGEIDPETVGRPLPGVEVRIDERGEVLTRCDGVCHGYFRRPEAFEEVRTEDGWLRSGDAGLQRDDGHLVIIDRVSDVMHTAAGHLFSPQFIENKLKFSPFIKEAVVVGDGRPFTSAMINIDPMTVGKWAEDRGLGYTTYADLSQNPEVGELLLAEVRAANNDLQEPERIRRFVLLYKLLDADDEELTRTGKVRRAFVAERYADILEALYATTRRRVRVRAEYRYQDGQVTEVDTEVAVLEPGAGPVGATA
jgi:long-chain acyl-CoA synthetase